MIDNKKILAFIPARGGSKGIYKKNIRDLCGKPLIAYTIEAARKSEYIDSVVVSTDDEEIASVSLEYGAAVPFMRPTALATDEAKIIDSVLYTVNELQKCDENYDALVLLQPTQPLRTVDDIDTAIEKFIKNNCRSLVSVSEINDHPILMRRIDEFGNMSKYIEQSSTVRRQDMEKLYRVNGCIYISAVSELSENTSFNDNQVPFVMKKEHSVDIDEEEDLWIAEMYIQRLR